MVAPTFSVLLALAQAPQGPAPLWTLSGPDLRREVAERPGEARNALRHLYQVAIGAGDPDEALRLARQIALAYLESVGDSFPLRDWQRFATAPDREREARVRADSLRLAGNTAFRQEGIPTAMRFWRRSFDVAKAARDTFAMGAALGNIATGHLQAGRLDSAERAYGLASTLAVAVGDWQTAGNAVGAEAAIQARERAFARAFVLFDSASTLRLRAGDNRGAAADLNNLADLAWELGDTALARRQYGSALAINRRLGADHAVATNLANLASLETAQGALSTARGLYGEALAMQRRLGAQREVAALEHQIGLLELRAARFSRAVSHLRAALAAYRETGTPAERTAVYRDLAQALAARGAYSAAASELHEAERILGDGADHWLLRAQVGLTRGDLALALNALGEAEPAYRDALDWATRAGHPGLIAEVHLGLAAFHEAAGSPDEARRSLDAASRAARPSNAVRGMGLAELALARLLARSDRRDQALTAAASAERRLAQSGDAAARLTALALLGDLHRDAGRPAVAESLYAEGLRLARMTGAIELEWPLHRGLGLSLRQRHALVPAAAALERAVESIEAVATGIRASERRVSFLSDKWAPYRELAAVYADLGQTASAFAVSERLRARLLLELFARGPLPTPSGPLADTLEALRVRIAQLTSRLVVDVPRPSVREGGGLAGNDATRQALAAAQSAWASRLVQWRDQHPRHAALVTLETTTSTELEQAIPPGTALIEYLVDEDGVMAFVVRRDGTALRRLPGTAADLRSLVRFTRATMVQADLRPDAPWQTPTRVLYQRLIAPLEDTGMLEGVRSLVIVPHDELHFLPFETLARAEDGSALLTRYTVTYAPSASVWVGLDRRPAARPASVVALAPRSAVLPGTQAEVAAIRRVFGSRAETYAGADATEAVFRRSAPEADILHIGSIGVLNRQNPLFSFIELTPGGEDDGRLEVHEIFPMQVQASLVVLSACETALASGTEVDVPPGDDWVGLVQAFLTAGARAVLATLWPVDDEATAAFMTQFYTHLMNGRAAAEALAATKHEFQASTNYHQPYYWAGFVLVGR